MRRIIGVLLAAGRGRRFGSNKLLAPLTDGTPLAVAAARRLAAAVPEAIAVVRRGDAELSACLAAQGLRIVECPDAELGLGHSLAAGIAATATADAWLIALGDMPYIKNSTFASLVAHLAAGSALIAPLHAGRRGHPVGFAAEWRAELLSLKGDGGARDLLVRHASLLPLLRVEDPGILKDIDPPADLAAEVAGDSVSTATSCNS